MIQTGLDALLRERLDLLRGRRVGLVAHPAAVLPDLTDAATALLHAGVRLTELFGPEHGFAGAAGAGADVGHATDRRSGLPVFSLYGPTHEPDAALLADVDVLLFDMQDVGARFYTYLSTLFYVLRGAARSGVPVLVLDRPNPLGGAVEGPRVAPGYESFVGIAPVPVRHGLTLGEAARLLNATRELGADLTVVPMRGWRRDLWFDQTGLLWIMTSPAMPHLTTATLYPGMCLLEGTNVAHGRGTALPFEVCGAPWLDGDALAEQLNRCGLPGVRFRAHRFVPLAEPYAGQLCDGVQAHVTDRAALRPVTLGLELIAAIRAQKPDAFAWRAAHFDRLIGGPDVRAALDAGVPALEIAAGWRAACAQFEAERKPFLLYK